MRAATENLFSAVPAGACVFMAAATILNVLICQKRCPKKSILRKKNRKRLYLAAGHFYVKRRNAKDIWKDISINS